MSTRCFRRVHRKDIDNLDTGGGATTTGPNATPPPPLSVKACGAGGCRIQGPGPAAPPVNLEACDAMQMQIMYVDALRAYYREGKAGITDGQFNERKMERNWQGSEFPSLCRTKI